VVDIRVFEYRFYVSLCPCICIYISNFPENPPHACALWYKYFSWFAPEIVYLVYLFIKAYVYVLTDINRPFIHLKKDHTTFTSYILQVQLSLSFVIKKAQSGRKLCKVLYSICPNWCQLDVKVC
jgi:hypothetical protein